MQTLEKTYPSLTKFSDLNWEEVARDTRPAVDGRPAFDFVTLKRRVR